MENTTFFWNTKRSFMKKLKILKRGWRGWKNGISEHTDIISCLRMLINSLGILN